MQQYLDYLAENDSAGFLKDVDTWCNHRPLLLLALSLTEGEVGEFGAGHGSTPYLRKYCEDKKRPFYSYDNNKEWAEVCGATCVWKWSDPDLYRRYSVVLVDHSPGEHRHEAVAILRGGCDIIVIHDSEEGGAGGYMYEKIYPLFKYRLNINRNGGGAGASALSNKIDLHQFSGLDLGGFKLE